MPVKLYAAAVFAVLLLQPAQAESIIDNESTAPDDVAQEIEKVILRWKENWNSGNWRLIQNDWDPDEEAP